MLLATTVISGVMFLFHTRFRAFSGLTFLIGVPALVFTLARSAAIALVVVALIFAWQNRQHRYFPLIAITVLSRSVAALPFVPDIFWERMATMTDFGVNRTLLRRVSYNLIGLDLLWQQPLLGVGRAIFRNTMRALNIAGVRAASRCRASCTISFFAVAVEMGLVGITTFMLIMVNSLKKAIDAARSNVPMVSSLAAAVGFGFGALLLAWAFMPNEDTKFMWILPGLCVAAWRVSRMR